MIPTKPEKRSYAIPAKALLKADGWTTFDIAHASGTTASQVSQFLNGHTKRSYRIEQSIRLIYPLKSDQRLFGELRSQS